MARPQQKPQPSAETGKPGLKVVDKTTENAAPAEPAKAEAKAEAAASKAAESEAAARRRRHPPRVWPD
jgi:hypothetical protein